MPSHRRAAEQATAYVDSNMRDLPDSLNVEAEKASAFLEMLAEHLDGSEMPDKAADCLVVARRLRTAAEHT